VTTRKTDFWGGSLLQPAVLVLLGVVLTSVTVRIWLASKIAVPQLLCDEFIYADVAKNIARHGDLQLRDQPWGGGVLYPIAIAPAWFFDSMASTFDAVKGINVAFMTVTALPLYLWARRLMSPGYAVLPVLLFLLIPGFTFTIMVMTENAFLPGFIVACFAIALTVETPTLPRQAFALLAIGLACAVRLQGLVLVPILLTAIPLSAILAMRAEGENLRPRPFARRLRPYWASAGLFAGAALAYIVVETARGNPLAGGLGSYQTIAEADYTLRDVAYWTLRHVADLVLTTAVVPVSAFIVLLGLAIGGSTTQAERAFLAVTTTVVFWTTIQVGAFASTVAGWIVERYLFYVTPLLFLALALWLARGLPRPRRLTALAFATPLALLLAVPITLISAPSLAVNTLGLFPFYELSQALSGDETKVRAVLWAGAALAAVVFSVVPRFLALFAAPAIVAGFLSTASYYVFSAMEGQSIPMREIAGPEPSWVEERVGSETEAAFLYRPGTDTDVTQSSASMLQTQFWNPSLRTVYNLGVPEICPLPERMARIDLASGQIVPAERSTGLLSQYVVAERDLHLAGERLAEGGWLNLPLALYRIDPPLRLEEHLEGVFRDGWMGSAAAYTRYGSPAEAAGEVAVTVSRTSWGGEDVPGNVLIRTGTVVEGEDGAPRIGEVTATRRWTIHSSRFRTFFIPTPGPTFRIEMQIEPTFSPSDFGQPDIRQLGAQVSFRFHPSAAR
jgi:hypothetical protein